MNNKKGVKVIIFTLFMILFYSTVCYAVPIPMAEGLLKIGHNVYIQPEQVEDSDVIAIGGDIYISGTVNANVICIGGKVYVNGSVKGDVTVIGGSVNSGPQGKINGKTTEICKNFKMPLNLKKWNFNDYNRHYFGRGSLISFILLFVFAFVIYEIMPGNEVRMALETRNNLGKSLLYGYIASILIPVLAIVLILTVIGILLVPVLLIAVYVIYLIGFTSLTMYCGKRLSMAMFNRPLPDIWCILIGIGVYEIIKSITFAGIGTIVSLLFIVPLSIGIALSTKFGTFRPWRRNNDDSEWDRYRRV